MADHNTAIEWTQAPGYKGETWNPVTGCDRVSPGCAHCYALDEAARMKRKEQGRIAKARAQLKPDLKVRYQRDGDPKTSGPGFGLTLHPDKLDQPLRWRKPRMVFVNSMSDLFHEEIPDEYIAKVFAVMALAPQHVFQVLTKRPERMRDFLTRPVEEDADFLTRPVEEDAGWAVGSYATWAVRDQLENVALDASLREDLWDVVDDSCCLDLPLPNVWLGVSIENRRFVHRADLLRETPAAVRFISAEPLLGPLVPNWFDGETEWDALDEGREIPYWPDGKLVGDDDPALDLTRISWLIAGGESGPSHRPVHPNWVRALRDACRNTGDLCTDCAGGGHAMRNGMWSDDPCPTCGGSGHLGGTRFFFKQWGGRTSKAGGRELDGRTWSEWPAALPVREAVPS